MDFLFKCFIFRRNDLDLTQSNVFHLTKNILLNSDELSQECLSMILSLNVWQTFYLPVLGLKVASHFKQTAISQSCASFLSNILTKFCQNSDFDSVCHSVFSDLANQNGKILFCFIFRKDYKFITKLTLQSDESISYRILYQLN